MTSLVGTYKRVWLTGGYKNVAYDCIQSLVICLLLMMVQ